MVSGATADKFLTSPQLSTHSSFYKLISAELLSSTASGQGESLSIKLSLILEVIQERLRQSRLSFNLAFGLTLTSAVVIVVGIGLLMLGKVSEGSFAIAGGFGSKIPCVYCLRLTKEANDSLQESLEKLLLNGED